MAERLIFISGENANEPYFKEDLINFDYSSGFAVSQKQKSIRSLHENALARYKGRQILEVSTKSEDPTGVRLSAFNLRFKDEDSGAEYPLENVFQSSKVYEAGGPYRDLLNVPPKDAKRDERHNTSGDLTGFIWKDWECPLKPETMFYDWIYCTALAADRDLVEEVMEAGYSIFTDIEFNHKRSINCQARSMAIFTSLCRRGQLEEYIEDKAKWKTIYQFSRRLNLSR